MRSLPIIAPLLLAACATNMWLPVGQPRTAVPFQQVQFLEAPPAKPFDVVGIITPPDGEYDTDAQAVQAMRKEAAKHGADAIFIESRTEKEGWGFSAGFGGASGGSGSSTAFRAKAIIWK